jgi:hypothetical protein
MGTFVLGLFLENVLVPLILAGSIAALSRLVPISARPPLLLGAMVLAVGASFLLAFGPPPWPPAGARTKLLLALGLAGIAGWLLDDREVTTAGRLLRAGVILLPALWIAVPALDLGHKNGLALAALVTAAGLSSDALRPDNAARRLAAIALMALGLAWIAIFAQSYGVLPDGRKVKHYYAAESVGIATGILITAIHHAGLVSLTHTPSPMGFLNDILGRPANERPFLLLVVGYPASDARVPDITRKPLDEIATFV